MMGDKTPSAAWDEVRDLIHGKTAAQSREEFNRWLTQHDQEVRDSERDSIVRYLSAYPTAEVRYLALFIARMGHHDVQ